MNDKPLFSSYIRSLNNLDVAQPLRYRELPPREKPSLIGSIVVGALAAFAIAWLLGWF